MKPSPEKIITVTLLCLFLAGCKKNYVLSDKQLLLFQYQYLNYAWGYTHTGFLIDSEGNVLKYRNPQDWNFYDKDSTLSATQVSQNILKCTKTGIKIPEEELHKYAGYIKNIASSKVTAVKNVAVDEGSMEYLCFMYSENTNIYRCCVIKTEGNFRCENLNFYSKRVTDWMKEINGRLKAD
jgi:hypothetical protein